MTQCNGQKQEFTNFGHVVAVREESPFLPSFVSLLATSLLIPFWAWMPKKVSDLQMEQIMLSDLLKTADAACPRLISLSLNCQRRCCCQCLDEVELLVLTFPLSPAFPLLGG